MEDEFEKNTLDALLIIHFNIERSIPEADIEWLRVHQYIEPKYPTGWMTTTKGSDMVLELH